MKLYYCPATRSFTALWMMEEVGEPYELVRVDVRGPGHPTDDYRRINPMGKVPGLVDGDCAMGETAAILLHVADRFPQSKLAPGVHDPRRGRFLQWLMFGPTTIEPAMMERRLGTPPNTLSAGWGDYDRALGTLENALRPGPWLLGDAFTAADLYIASTLGFGMRFGLIDQRPAFLATVERTGKRPAFQRATAIEERESKAPS